MSSVRDFIKRNSLLWYLLLIFSHNWAICFLFFQNWGSKHSKRYAIQVGRLVFISFQISKVSLYLLFKVTEIKTTQLSYLGSIIFESQDHWLIWAYWQYLHNCSFLTRVIRLFYLIYLRYFIYVINCKTNETNKSSGLYYFTSELFIRKTNWIIITMKRKWVSKNYLCIYIK